MKRQISRALSLALVLAMLLSMTAPVFAQGQSGGTPPLSGAADADGGTADETAPDAPAQDASGVPAEDLSGASAQSTPGVPERDAFAPDAPADAASAPNGEAPDPADPAQPPADASDSLPAPLAETDAEGFTKGTEEGSDYWWKLDEATGTLTIKGTKMADFVSNSPPWRSAKSSIKSVVIQSGMKNIGDSTFSWYSSLTDVTFPASLTSIGDSAFSGCSSLTGGLTLPAGVTNIGERAFWDCSSLTGNLTIPEGVTSIGEYAFSGCSGLTGSLTLPAGLTSIGDSAFSDCGGLTGTLTIPAGVTSIGDSAFYGCSSLTGIILPARLTNLGEFAFYNCSGLTGNLMLPAGLTSIARYAFYNCSGLTGSLTLPAGLTSISNHAFADCGSLTGSLTIPADVTFIGDAAFDGCSGLTGVTLPESLTSIGDSAFSHCSGLTDVTLPKSLKSISNYAFFGCSGLTGTLAIPAGVTSIGDSAFFDCRGLTGVTFPTGLTSIGNSAFGGLSGLTGNLTLPEGLTNIGDSSFYGCDGLTGITFPTSLTSIGKQAFTHCRGLTGSLMIPESVTSIGDSAFSDCRGLTGSLTIPKSVTSIGDYAFEDCRGLTGSLTIPESVTSIGERAFQNCFSLEKFEVAEANAAYCSVDGILYNKEKTKLIQVPHEISGAVMIPNGITSIPESAFSGRSGLTDITLPAEVTSIGRSAFWLCSGLTGITLPARVTSIGDSTFYGCSGLTGITLPAGVTSIGDSAFSGCRGLTDVYYSGTEEQWKKITISSGNNNLLYAVIHYNCAGVSGFNQNVRFLSSYSAEKGAVQFNVGPAETGLDHTLADMVDAAQAARLVGTYVQVETDADAPLVITGLAPVESAIGQVSALELPNITIDGVAYPIAGDDPSLSAFADDYLGKTVLYHRRGGKVVAFSVLEEKVGVLQSWNAENRTLTILDTDGLNAVVYPTNALSELSGVEQLVEQRVAFLCGSDHAYAPVFRIAKYTNIPEHFNAALYHADWLATKSDELQSLERETPSQIVQSPWSDGANEFWRMFSALLDVPTGPAASLSKVLANTDREDYYEALILDALQASVKAKFIPGAVKDANSAVKGFVSNLSTLLKQKYLIDLSKHEDYQKLVALAGDQSGKRPELCEDIEKNAKQWFGENHPFLGDVSEMSKAIADYLKYTGWINDWYNYIYTCVALQEVDQCIRQVLEEMLASCQSDPAYGSAHPMTRALEEVRQMFQNASGSPWEIMGRGALKVGGEKIAPYVLDKIWSKVASSSDPNVQIILAAISVGKSISNFLGNSDDTAEAYLKMKCITEIEAAADKVLASHTKHYTNDDQTQQANLFLAAVRLSFHLRDTDCETAASYLEELDSAALLKLGNLLGTQDRTVMIQKIRSIQDIYKVDFVGAETNWINYLEDDFPGSGLAAQYEYLFQETMQAILQKELVASAESAAGRKALRSRAAAGAAQGVDVFVYNDADECVAYAENGVVSCTVGDLAIVEDAGKIIVQFFDGAHYRVEYAGGGTGEMNLTVNEFDTEEKIIRTVDYRDVPLAPEKTYSVAVSSETMKPYVLSDASETVDFSYDSMQEKTEYQVSVRSGYLRQQDTVCVETAAAAGETLFLEAAVPEGCVFVRWEASSENAVIADAAQASTSMIMPSEDVTVSAVIQDPQKNRCITLDPNGGTVHTESLYTDDNGLLAALPVPERTGYTFDGWYTEAQGGEQVTAGTVYRQDTTLYAHWTENGVRVKPESGYYLENDWLCGVAPGTTLTALKANLENSAELTIKNAKGETLTGDAPVGTGCTVGFGEDGETGKVVVMIDGDVDGNGKITMLDVVSMRQSILRIKSLRGAYLRAAMPVTQTGSGPKLNDVTRVRQYLLRIVSSVVK